MRLSPGADFAPGGLNSAPYRVNGGRAVNVARLASQLKTKRGKR